MNVRSLSLALAGLSAAALLPATMALAHSGHGAPSVHAHAGSPSMLAVIGLVALGTAAVAGLARLVTRHHRLRRHR